MKDKSIFKKYKTKNTHESLPQDDNLYNSSKKYHKQSEQYKQIGKGLPKESEYNCKNTKISSSKLYYIQAQIDKANKESNLGTYFILDNPITNKKDLNYWVSTEINNACDVIEYNRLSRSEQFEKAYKQIRKDRIYEEVSPIIQSAIENLNYKK